MPDKIPPYFLVRTIDLFRGFLLRLNRSLFPGNVVLYEQFQNLWLMPSLYTVATLNVAECLKTGPKKISDLAEETGSDTESLYRVMRALSSTGIFKQGKERTFALNGRARALLNGDSSLRHMLMQHLGPVNWSVLGNLLYTVKTGREAFPMVHGKDMYAFLQEHPAEFELFDRSMSNLSNLGLAPLLRAYSFKKYRIIADIGGGEGFLLSNILLKYKKATGILFDLPEALVKAPLVISGYKLDERIKLVPGNFFDSVPVKADVYILKNIIHNWNDEDASRILSNINDFMPPHSKILVMDMIVPASTRPSLSKLLDIQMMASFANGRERTRDEFEKLAEKAGLRISHIIPTISAMSIIEMSRQF